MENKTQETKDKQSLSEIAKKKRHLHLVEKLHEGKALSKQEISEIEDFEREKFSKNLVRKLSDVSEALDVSRRTVLRWKDQGMPGKTDGYYDVDKIRKWYEQHHGTLEESNEKLYWEIKVCQYRAELLNLELEKAKGNLLDREEVEQGRVRRILIVKHAFLALPSRMAPILAMKTPLEIQKLLYEAIADIIQEFSGEKKADG